MALAVLGVRSTCPHNLGRDPLDRHFARLPKESSTMEWTEERRSHRRYPIHADLRYTLHPYHPPTTGSGRTINVSKGGVLFESETALPEDMRIRLSIAWPVMLNNKVGLRLHGIGRVVRSQGSLVAVKIFRYDFRTMSLR